jgi:hypothetical protein
MADSSSPASPSLKVKIHEAKETVKPKFEDITHPNSDSTLAAEFSHGETASETRKTIDTHLISSAIETPATPQKASYSTANEHMNLGPPELSEDNSDGEADPYPPSDDEGDPLPPSPTEEQRRQWDLDPDSVPDEYWLSLKQQITKVIKKGNIDAILDQLDNLEDDTDRFIDAIVDADRRLCLIACSSVTDQETREKLFEEAYKMDHQCGAHYKMYLDSLLGYHKQRVRILRAAVKNGWDLSGFWDGVDEDCRVPTWLERDNPLWEKILKGEMVTPLNNKDAEKYFSAEDNNGAEVHETQGESLDDEEKPQVGDRAVDASPDSQKIVNKLHALDEWRKRLIEYIEDADKSIHLIACSSTTDAARKSQLFNRLQLPQQYEEYLQHLLKNHETRLNLVEQALDKDLSAFLSGKSVEEIRPSNATPDRPEYELVLRGEAPASEFRKGDTVRFRCWEDSEGRRHRSLYAVPPGGLYEDELVEKDAVPEERVVPKEASTETLVDETTVKGEEKIVTAGDTIEGASIQLIKPSADSGAEALNSTNPEADAIKTSKLEGTDKGECEEQANIEAKKVVDGKENELPRTEDYIFVKTTDPEAPGAAVFPAQSTQIEVLCPEVAALKLAEAKEEDKAEEK